MLKLFHVWEILSINLLSQSQYLPKACMGVIPLTITSISKWNGLEQTDLLGLLSRDVPYESGILRIIPEYSAL